MSQLFKKSVPIELLYDFLKNNSNVFEKYYVINNTTYKTAKFHEHTTKFLSSIKEYYHESKKYYATRPDTYNNFVTIIRQICKLHSIPYTSRKQYMKSSYSISYHIFK